jgi:hypothetical protein
MRFGAGSPRDNPSISEAMLSMVNDTENNLPANREEDKNLDMYGQMLQ